MNAKSANRVSKYGNPDPIFHHSCGYTYKTVERTVGISDLSRQIRWLDYLSEIGNETDVQSCVTLIKSSSRWLTSPRLAQDEKQE